MVFESFFSLANSTCFSILIRMSEILFILIHSGQDVFCFQEIDFTIKYGNNVLKKYEQESFQSLNMEQFNEIVFSKRKKSSFTRARRNALNIELSAILIQEIVSQLTKYIGKRMTSFKKIHILLHDEWNAECFGRTRFVEGVPVRIDLYIRNHSSMDHLVSTFLHELAHSLTHLNVRHGHQWVETTALLFAFVEKILERPSGTNVCWAPYQFGLNCVRLPNDCDIFVF